MSTNRVCPKGSRCPPPAASPGKSEKTGAAAKANKAEETKEKAPEHYPPASAKGSSVKYDPTIRMGVFRMFPSTVYGTQELMTPEMLREPENTVIEIGLKDIGNRLDKIAKGVAVKGEKSITRNFKLLSGLDPATIDNELSHHLKTLTSPARGTPTAVETGLIQEVQRLQARLVQVQGKSK